MKCKYCNSVIEGNEKYCPYCGKEIVYGKRLEPSKTGRSSKTWLWILCVILFLGIVCGGWYFFSSAKYQTFTVGDVTFKMILVEGGTFTMGATSEQGSDANSYEEPTHQVTLSSYYIGETEVTQELWQAVMGNNHSHFSGSIKPVDDVSWDECQEFIRKLNALTGENFRLPTEAEWEYAARGGNKSLGYKYAGSDTIDNVAWYWENSYKVGSDSPDYGTHAVATKSSNELGLYDMSGSVYEWCHDWSDDYSSDSQTNPTGPEGDPIHRHPPYYRVCRGGSWGLGTNYSRVSCREGYYPNSGRPDIGLRLAL